MLQRQIIYRGHAIFDIFSDWECVIRGLRGDGQRPIYTKTLISINQIFKINVFPVH